MESWLEMDIAMMKPIMQAAILMAVIVVEGVPILTIVQIVSVMKNH